MNIKDIRQALAYNKSNNLYQSDANYLRIYFTYSGGKYNGQRDSIHSEYQLEKALEYEGQIVDIEIISTSKAWQEWLPAKV